MHSPTDRTAKAVIRDTAIELLGAEMTETVSLKRIADAAGVSAALIIKHYRSREGLIAAADEFVLDRVSEALRAVALGESTAAATAAAVDSRYLSRLLLSGGQRAKDAFAALERYSRELVAGMAETGTVASGVDHERLAVTLLAHDLAVVLLRDHLTAALGRDPLDPDGLPQWMAFVEQLYAGRAITPPAES